MKFIKMKSVAGNAKLIFCLAVILLLSLWGAPQAFAATWTLESTTSPDAYYISYANGKFYLTGSGGLLTSSNDCSTWNPLTSGTGDITNNVAFGNSNYVVGVNDGSGISGSLILSDNGTTWGKYDTSEPIYCVAYGDGTFVAGTDIGNIFYSNDGISWTEVLLDCPTSRSINWVTYANGKFVAVGGNSGEGFSYTSEDGINWSLSNYVTTSVLWAVAGGTDGAGNPVFVTVSENGAIFSSPDGATWTVRVPGLPAMNGVTYGNGEFVAVGFSGTVKTSTDGVNWATDTVPENPDLFSVTYGGNVFAILDTSGGVYTRSAISPPAVTGISQSSGPTAGGTVVTITGTNLAGATSVKFGSSSGTITANTPTSITVTSPAGSAGTVDITVTTAGGTSGTSASDRFTYFAQPTVTGITPADGLSAGGTSVTITGTNLTGTTAVTIGGASATGITVVNSTTITATTPAGTAGVQDVIVTTPGGSGTGTGIYTYTVAPTVTTQAVSAITSTTATGNGNITSLGLPNPTQYGVVWNTSSGPTTALSTKTTQGAVSTTGAFTSSITGLTPNTTYYVRAYAANTAGTSYGAEVSFTTLPAATTPTGDVTTNINGNIKKDAEISLSSETGATIYYTVAVNMLPSDPTVLSSSISNGGTITNPTLTFGDVLNIKAYAVVASKSDSAITTLSYTVQSKSELTLTGITLSNKEYDGNTDATADFTGAGLSGKIGADVVTLTGTPSASFLTADAADGKTVAVSGYSLTGADAEYYTLNTTLTPKANITKRALILGTIIIADKEYDGTGTATITSIPISSGIVGSDEVYVDVASASAAFDAGKDIGTGKAVTVSGIQLTGADSGNYSVSATAAATGEITAKTVSVNSVTIAGKAYDGNTTATITGATLTGKVGTEDVTIDYMSAVATFDTAQFGIGKSVTVTGLILGGTDKANYVLDSDSFTTTGTITSLGTSATPTDSVGTNTDGSIKKDASITLFSEAGATIYYTTAVNSATPAAPNTSSSSVTNGGVITLPTLTYGDVLKIKAIAVVGGKSDSTIAALSYTVQSKSELTLTGITLSNKEYDGNTDAVADFTGADLSGKIGADVVTLTGTPSASFLTADAADGKTVTVSGYSLTGADAEYYTLNTTLTPKANITPKVLTLGTIIIADKEYDGTGTATITSIPISSGIVGSDEVSVDVTSASAAFDTGSGIGTGKAVTVSGIQLTGADSDNYSVSATAAATGEIAAKTVSASSVTIAGKAYDGNTTALITGATLTGKVGTEDVTIDYSSATATFDDALVGNGKTVTVTGLILGGGDKANYVLDSGSFTTTGNISGLGTIAEPTASIADGTVIKSGATVTLITVGYDGTTLYYTVGSAPQNPTSEDASIAAGGTITITGNPGDTITLKVYGTKAGYADSPLATRHYNIQPKSTLTVSGAVATSKDYEGTRTAAVSGGVLSGSIVGGDDVTLDASTAAGLFSDKNAGTAKTVTVSGYALTGDDAMYYDLTQPTLTADIRVKNITVSSIEISDKVYDGSTTADISNITLSWKASGDEVYINTSAVTAVFDDASIGSNKTVTITGLELAGTDVGNYQLTSTTASATGNIVPEGIVATPEASPSEGSILSGTSITLTTATSGATIHYTMNGDEPTGSSSEYTEPITLTGDPGTVITVKAMAEKAGMTDSGTLTQQYTIAEPGALILNCTPGNRIVTLSWNEIPSTVTYAVYGEGSFLGNGVSIGGGKYGYDATGLTNGTLYNFTVNALDSEQRITNSAHDSATPRTVPGVPTDVTAVAGNRQATVSFNVPSDNGGSEITRYIVTSSPGGITASGEGSPITVTGLTNGTAYTFRVKAVNGAGNGIDSSASGAVTPRAPASDNSHSDDSTNEPPAPPAPPAPPVTNPATPTTSVTEILVNGQAENAGTTTVATIDNQTVTTITVDDKKIEEKLNTEGNNATVVIAVNNASDKVIGVLNGQTIKNMETKEAVLEIKTGSITYTIPASEINIDAVSAQIGEQVALKDIKINISVAVSPVETVRIVEDSANRNNYQIVVKPVEFEITCTSGNKTVEVSKFNAFVERTIAIPDGIDPSKITTGIVLNNDGTFSHVPTTITIIDGKYYAKINSLTNSIYSVIYNPKAFKDVESHWAKEAVNDMGSRLVVNGDEQGRFEPDKNITRAEFAAIVVRALGLMRPGIGNDSFKDVAKDAWYYDAVSIANQCGIITGYGDGKFRPMDSITREQAMTMVARAMKITGLKANLAEDEMNRILEAFSDASMSEDYTKYGIAACIENGIVSGRNGKLIAPKDNITRAETAMIISRLLRASGLI